MYIYIYIYIYICICVYIYIYIYIEREILEESAEPVPALDGLDAGDHLPAGRRRTARAETSFGNLSLMSHCGSRPRGEEEGS